MARAGRKRKSGRRQPSGKLAPDKSPDDRKRIAAQPHRQGAPEALRGSERAESPLGRLSLCLDETGDPIISAEQYDAGELFAAMVWAYRAVLGAPRASAAAGPGFECLVESSGEPAACQQDPDGCTCLRRRTAYTQAFEALARAGRPAVLAVKRVVIHREAILEQDLGTLKVGLTALAEHFGLRAGKRMRAARAA